MKHLSPDPITDKVVDIIWLCTGKDFNYDYIRLVVYIFTGAGAIWLLTILKTI